MNKQDLIQLLKRKRRDIADREGKKLYFIFQNDVLERTVEAMPKNKKDLESIKGWGKKRIARYGDEILEIMNNNAEIGSVNGKKDILSVKEFIYLVNNIVSQLGAVKVRGEISDMGGREGFRFFDLKDTDGDEHVVKCFITGTNYNYFRHLLEDGLEVMVKGIPSLYKSGYFRIVVDSIEPIGEGALRKAFEALKKKLSEKGYFDEERKRILPEFIQRIGVITSSSGAVINDFLKNIGQYGFRIDLYDVRVEGDYAENEIIEAFSWFNRNRPDIDILVLIRGGGGLENLKAFNSEKVAEAVISSRIPVVVGVGHEKDATIADYVADRTFSTPTAVAVFIRGQREMFIQRVNDLGRELKYAMINIVGVIEEKLKNNENILSSSCLRIIERHKYVVLNSVEIMRSGLQKIFINFKNLENQFINALGAQKIILRQRQYRVNMISRDINNLFPNIKEVFKKRLEIAQATLAQLNPDNVLKRGYSIVYTGNNKILKDARQVEVGENMTIKPSKGKIISTIIDLEN